MPKNKNLFQDMVRVKKESTVLKERPALSKIPSISKKEDKEVSLKTRTKEKIVKINEPDDFHYEKNKGGPKYGFWIIAIICIIGLFFASSFVFSKAIITVEPESKAISLNDSFSALKNSQTAENLSFDVVSLSGEESKVVPAGEEKQVEEKAYGKVIIYNTFSTAPQSLNIDTRLIGTNGKIYKTDKKITVPGMKKDGTPGSVEVGIFAEKAGVEYNSGPMDFKIIGFKGTSKYDKFFAKSKGDIAGGFVGLKKDISDLDKLGAFSELKKALSDRLYEKAVSQIPEGIILYKDASSFDITEELIEDSGLPGEVRATIRATFYGVLVEEKELAKNIAEKQIDKYEGEEIFIPQIKSLDFTFKDENTNLSEVKNLDFNLSGNIVVVYRVDEASFKKELLGKKKNILAEILPNFPSIKSANLTLKPFWLQSLPKKENAINININYPN